MAKLSRKETQVFNLRLLANPFDQGLRMRTSWRDQRNAVLTFNASSICSFNIFKSSRFFTSTASFAFCMSSVKMKLRFGNYILQLNEQKRLDSFGRFLIFSFITRSSKFIEKYIPAQWFMKNGFWYTAISELRQFLSDESNTSCVSRE